MEGVVSAIVLGLAAGVIFMGAAVLAVTCLDRLLDFLFGF